MPNDDPGGMPEWLAPAIGAVGQIGGAIIGNRNRSKEARKGEQFSEQMRNTSWQAAVEDMKKAGLNPALAYSQGGASSPSGMMAQQSDVISDSVTGAQAARRLEKELKLLTTQETEVYERARLARAAAKKTSRESELVLRNQVGVELDSELKRLNMFSARNAARMEQGALGRVSPFANRIRQIIFGGGGPGSLLGGAAGAYIGTRGRKTTPPARFGRGY